MIKYLSIMLLLASSCGLQAMSYVKSWFQAEKCLEGKPERLKSFEGFKKDIKDGKLIDTNKVFIMSYKSEGKDTCILEEIGKEEKTNLYTMIGKVISDASNPSFFRPENLKAARKTLDDANTSLRVIHLGATEEIGGTEYKLAEGGLRKIDDKLKELEKAAEDAAMKKELDERMKKLSPRR